MKPDPYKLATRIQRYMSSPDYEGGDGPATARGKIEDAIRKEYAEWEEEIKKPPRQKEGRIDERDYK